MAYFYLVLLGLALAFPEVGHEAGAENALITSSALLPQAGFLMPETLQKIAKCESGDKHFDKEGRVLVGEYNSYDIGRYQINSLFWEEQAKKLGYDIYTEAGNEAFALHLYHKYGTSPWKRSEWCWAG